MAFHPIITLTTDFGLNDHFVGTIKGAILNIAPEAEIVDICHSVQAFDILDGALALAQSYSYFPSRTVAPDNGVLSLMYAREERLSVRHITADHYFLQPVSNTFHGRDIFAPVAAYLAKGVDHEKFGDEITDFVRFNAPKPKAVDAQTLRGVVLKVDRFGNLVTNITPQDTPALFQAQVPAFKIVVGKKEVTGIKTNYAEGTPGEVFAIFGSMGYLEIAANRAAAAQLVGVGKGAEVSVVLEGAVAAGNGQ